MPKGEKGQKNDKAKMKKKKDKKKTDKKSSTVEGVFATKQRNQTI